MFTVVHEVVTDPLPPSLEGTRVDSSKSTTVKGTSKDFEQEVDGSKMKKPN